MSIFSHISICGHQKSSQHQEIAWNGFKSLNWVNDMCCRSLLPSLNLQPPTVIIINERKHMYSKSRGWHLCWCFTIHLLEQGLCRKLTEIFHYSVAFGSHTSSTLDNPHICNRYGCCFSAFSFFCKEFIHRNLVENEKIFDLEIKWFEWKGSDCLNANQRQQECR